MSNIIVRKNNNLNNPIFDKAFNIYLKLDDGTEHEIPGVVSVTNNRPLPTGPYHIYTVEFSVCDELVRFE